MSAYVEIQGVGVDQETLCRMFAALSEHRYFSIPAGYAPTLDLFGPLQGESTAPPEQIVYAYIEDGSMPTWFAEEFLGRATPAPDVRPTDVLERAGFPAIVSKLWEPWQRPTPPKVTRWASGLGAPGPWLLVRSDTAKGGQAVTCTLAQAALSATDKGTSPDAIAYKRAEELCQEVNSSDLYGESSKFNALAPYRRCSLLALDGMGGERATAHELDTLASLFAARHDQMLPTVLGFTVGFGSWVDRYRGVDAGKADAMSDAILHALAGYPKESTDRKNLLEASTRNVIDLSERR